MKCRRCTHQNPFGVKYCRNCGQMIGALCPGSTTVNLLESDFYNQRGQFLPNPLFLDVMKNATPQTATVKRKYETVLFSDLSIYTTLTQRLDLGEVKEIIARLNDNRLVD